MVLSHLKLSTAILLFMPKGVWSTRFFPYGKSSSTLQPILTINITDGDLEFCRDGSDTFDDRVGLRSVEVHLRSVPIPSGPGASTRRTSPWSFLDVTARRDWPNIRLTLWENLKCQREKMQDNMKLLVLIIVFIGLVGIVSIVGLAVTEYYRFQPQREVCQPPTDQERFYTEVLWLPEDTVACGCFVGTGK